MAKVGRWPETADIVETVSSLEMEVGSLEMEREVGGRLGEGELDVLKIGNQGTPGFGRRREFVSVNAHMDHLAKEEEEEDMAWRSSMELDGHAGAAAKIIFNASQDIAPLRSSLFINATSSGDYSTP